jgi:hypothetical protein
MKVFRLAVLILVALGLIWSASARVSVVDAWTVAKPGPPSESDMPIREAPQRSNGLNIDGREDNVGKRAPHGTITAIPDAARTRRFWLVLGMSSALTFALLVAVPRNRADDGSGARRAAPP